MMGITIGIGDKWKLVAQRASERMSEMTGLECRIIDDWLGPKYEHAAWLKCRIHKLFPAEDSFFYFDSDIWCVKAWNPEKLFNAFNRDFIAVPAVDNIFIENECRKYELPIGGKYVCAGLMIFGHEHRSVFEYAESLHPNFGAWLDQTPINVALHRERTAVTRISQKFSAECHGGIYNSDFTKIPESDVVNFHFCSCGGDADRVLNLQERGVLHV